MHYQIQLKKGFFGRVTTVGWRIDLESTIEEAKRRREWGCADSVRVIDENRREVWRSDEVGGQWQRLWLWRNATIGVISLAGLIVVGLLVAT